MHDVEAHVMRNAVLDTKKRVDGRDLTGAPDPGGIRYLPVPWLGAFSPAAKPGDCGRHLGHQRG